MDAAFDICLVLSAIGLMQSAAMLLYAWEHRRYHLSRLVADFKRELHLRVTLFVPCKGLDVGMEGNLRSLFEQRYRPLDLCFLVESEAGTETNPAVAFRPGGAAVVVSEAIGGTEADFAQLMTLKARMLGMTSTTYVNSSGLPAEEQLTTARDQAILGRAIQHRFPRYYQYFATPSFRYRGREMRNHNGLLGRVQGVDGIKTGYTDLSGYNLVSSVRRDARHIVAVVLGGTSNAARDARMRQLIEDHVSQASVQRTAPIIAETAVPDTAQVDAIAPAPPSPVVPSPSPAVVAEASVEPVSNSPAADQAQVPTPRAKPAKLTHVVEHPPRRARRATTNTAATLNGRAAASMPAAHQPRHVERRIGAAPRPQ
jgi:D-alanyl-D-alanine carboxypeptidase